MPDSHDTLKSPGSCLKHLVIFTDLLSTSLLQGKQLACIAHNAQASFATTHWLGKQQFSPCPTFTDSSSLQEAA